MPTPVARDGRIAAIRSIGYLVTGTLLALAAAVVIVPTMVSSVARRPSQLGRDLVDWERRRAGIVLRRLVPERPGLARWRPSAWLGWQIVVGLPVYLAMTYLLIGGINALTFPIWWTAVGTPPVSPLPGVQVETWSTAALIPPIGLAYEVVLIVVGPRIGPRLATASLGVLGLSGIDHGPDDNGTRGAELRRIDRAIHDGVQAHLVNANMLVGIARQDPAATPQVKDHLETAGAEITSALAELRTIIDTLYPPVLADRGLAFAVRQLAERSQADCRVDIGQLGQVPPEIEAAAYFGVAETLANAVRHSGCTCVHVLIERDPDRLMCAVTDNGHGGALILRPDGTGGGSTGLAGLQARVNEFAGHLQIASPPGGPTRVTWELPCVS